MGMGMGISAILWLRDDAYEDEDEVGYSDL